MWRRLPGLGMSIVGAMGIFVLAGAIWAGTWAAILVGILCIAGDQVIYRREAR